MEWIPLYIADTTLDSTIQEDHSKSFTVPDNRLYYIDRITCFFTTGDDVANRQLEIRATDTNSNIVFRYWPDTTQPASKTYHWTFAPGATNVNTAIDCSLVYAIPELWLKGGWTLRIDDQTSSAVDSDFAEVFISGKIYSYQDTL